MPGRSPIWFPLTLLTLLTALSLWIDRIVQPPPIKPDGSARHDPDYRISNFNTVKTRASGMPRYALAATELVHYPDDDSTELKRPRFTQYSVNKPYTQIQAQRGTVSADGENVYFMDNVKVVRGATATKGELTVLTNYLHIIPERELAITDRAVSIRQAPTTLIHANGMEYNKQLGTLKLTRHVRVHYEKPGTQAAATPQTGAVKAAPSATPAPEPKAQTTQPRANAVKKPAKKSSRRKPETGKSSRRIRRHYEKSPS